ncbi:alkylation response protein AidB-like acyl-CoA dehydrogenase [Serratia fonticola]|jgi:alkylation response protein AidB-like acyl-CoA dehydrogenase|uniref:Alkylation response protein AidB-like acyl-CoA dehydrogenase n=1 Tax=Serratia fonticola TaxID=47917 RepID=A0A542BRQ0_SERFO|nr:acyl-CoA dehydrogenase family protein [Serratia fonticola]TQI81265.1 alkylation response protein AidB-like acyl-CoA dehydrogenase [Serratia fonticola]TQI96711.1 alkylation response protein AidB-like acyl-CoA dehydrogenase [Serratia fonticola]TVZ71207.1 alkylation response protein AidB-like acyl-CoA dehydrogenase [Serratia fonticola]
MNVTHTGTQSASKIPSTADDILERARRIVPLLREHSASIEEKRCLPNAVVDLLRDSGVFRAAMPKNWGGPELTSVQQTQLVEILATGDVSAAWCAMIGMDSGIYSGFFPEEIARQIYPSLDMANSGWIHPHGRADRVAGGFNVSGQWRFASGVTHCDVLVAGCLVYKDGVLEPDALTGEAKQWRVMVATPADFQINDTWFTTGLAGSGSLDYSVMQLFVPDERSFSFSRPYKQGPLHSSPDAILRKMSGVPLGMARACLDYVRSQVAERIDRETGIPWVNDVRVQSAIALAEMELAAARSSVYSSLDMQWQKLANREDFSLDDRVLTALARYNAFRTGRNIVQTLYDLMGGSSIYKRSPMDGWLRDSTTMCQHAVAQNAILQLAGKVLVGGQSTSPFF